MINWEVIAGLTILCLMLVGIWALALALYEIINHED